MELVIGALIIWVLPIWLTHEMAKSRGRHHGWWWGAFLGWLGVLIVALIGQARPEQQEGLPQCKEH